MQIFLILALIIAALAVVFAVQNTAPVTVSFLLWKTDSSEAVVLLVALCAGALISLLFSLPSLVKDKWSLRTHRKKLTDMEASLADHKGQLEQVQKQTADLEASLADHKSKLEDAQKRTSDLEASLADHQGKLLAAEQKLQEKQPPSTDLPPQQATGS